MKSVDNRRGAPFEYSNRGIYPLDRSASRVSVLPGPDQTGAAAADHRTAWRVLLILAVITGAITHGDRLFQYPLYITDEGVYMQRAWSLIREGAFSPYTYTYDHAPVGWIMIAAWVALLPHQFQAFGAAENAGRLLMLFVHLANVVLLIQITRRISGSFTAAIVAAFLYNFSPLAVFYDREVVLDNLMVFWVLVSAALATRKDRSVLTPMLSGLALGVAILTKENAIFFIPGIGYLLYVRYRPLLNRRFAFGLSAYFALAIVSLYFLYAVLKNELLPEQLDFNLNAPPGGHVALLYTIWQQLHRNQGSLLNPSSPVYTFSVGSWLPKDALLLVGGTVCSVWNLVYGLRDRQQRKGALAAGLLACGYLLYLARGSVILEFYVVPLVPFLAMNLGMVISRLLPFAAGRTTFGRAVAVGLLFVTLLSPVGGYVLARNTSGQTALNDIYNYKLNLTGLQAQELQYVRQHIPPDSRIIMDEEFWVDLHDIRPAYPYAVSHFEATGDPAVRDKLFQQNWENVDYIVMSNKMRDTMRLDNTNGQYNWIFDALNNHAQRVWMLQSGNIELEIWQIQH
jgi:4-amino-4-deoxy-L-arabinose transferase-like glycosyltransferase